METDEFSADLENKKEKCKYANEVAMNFRLKRQRTKTSVDQEQIYSVKYSEKLNSFSCL